MSRPRAQQLASIRADLKWDEDQRQWIANATVTTPSGANKRLQAPGSSTTKAVHRLSKLVEEVHPGPFELEPKVNVPPSRMAKFQQFQKDLAAFRELKKRVTQQRVELAIDFDRDFHMPVRTVGPLLGMSAQRLGRVLADYEMGKTASPVGRPHKNRDQGEGEDDDDV